MTKHDSWTTLNTDRLYSPRRGIPSVVSDDVIPSALVPYFSRRVHPPECATHFFVDDKRFEGIWRWPKRSLSRVAPWTLGPDFSVYKAMPLPLVAYQVYRARWFCRYWQENGHKVIPTLQWAGPATYDLCF